MNSKSTIQAGKTLKYTKMETLKLATLIIILIIHELLQFKMESIKYIFKNNIPRRIYYNVIVNRVYLKCKLDAFYILGVSHSKHHPLPLLPNPPLSLLSCVPRQTLFFPMQCVNHIGYTVVFHFCFLSFHSLLELLSGFFSCYSSKMALLRSPVTSGPLILWAIFAGFIFYDHWAVFSAADHPLFLEGLFGFQTL